MPGDLHPYDCDECGHHGIARGAGGAWTLCNFVINRPQPCPNCTEVVPFLLSCSNFSCWDLRCPACAHKHMTGEVPHECDTRPIKVIHNPDTCPGCPECGSKT